MDNLPVELACAIFAQLKVRKKNKQDLASCSLVSRRWRQITLPQLFEKLRITSRVHDYSKEACPAESEGKSHIRCNETNEADLVPQTGTGARSASPHFLLS